MKTHKTRTLISLLVLLSFIFEAENLIARERPIKFRTSAAAVTYIESLEFNEDALLMDDAFAEFLVTIFEAAKWNKMHPERDVPLDYTKPFFKALTKRIPEARNLHRDTELFVKDIRKFLLKRIDRLDTK